MLRECILDIVSKIKVEVKYFGWEDFSRKERPVGWREGLTQREGE